VDEVEFEFVGPGECERCRAMVGTISSTPIGQLHPNCNCSSEPRCNNTFDYEGSSTRYGPNGRCFIFDAEIRVRCWDGTESGLSLPIDMGCDNDELADDLWDRIEAEMEPQVQSLLDGCPDCDPPLVA